MSLSNLRIVYRLLLLVAIGAVGSLVIGVIALSGLRDRILSERQAVARQQVEAVVSLIKAIPQNDPAELRRQILHIVQTVRYDKTNYLWINDLNGTMLMHPLKPELNGTSVLNSKDAFGTPLFASMIAVVKASGSGFVPYYWQNPGEAAPRPKVSYVASVPELNALIGTGIYIDSVDAAFREEMVRLIWIGLIILAVTVVFAGILARGIVGPLTALAHTMRALAGGDLSVVVNFTGRRDEIGAMAANVQVFKERGLEISRLQQERENERHQAETEKRSAMTVLANDLEARIGDVVRTVTGAAEELETSAAAMMSTAGAARRRSQVVATASDAVARNAQAVAGATEQLSASIREISGQMRQSSDIAAQAVENARVTDAKMAELIQSAQRIGAVINLINSIAKQTNLLALNATIEAARAGEHGKGFAVVANEVKHLANQTAKATEEIQVQISGIQAATGDAADGIRAIGEIIERIDGITSATSQAIEQQSAATTDISSSIQQAAVGSADVSENIESVSNASLETGQAAEQVQEAAHGLTSEAARLRDIVTAFVSQIRAS